MKRGVEEGLGPGHIVLDGDLAPPNWAQPPIFGPCIVTKRLDGDPAPLPKRGKAPNFLPMSIVAKRLDGSRCYLVRRWASTLATLC